MRWDARRSGVFRLLTVFCTLAALAKVVVGNCPAPGGSIAGLQGLPSETSDTMQEGSLKVYIFGVMQAPDNADAPVIVDVTRVDSEPNVCAIKDNSTDVPLSKSASFNLIPSSGAGSPGLDGETTLWTCGILLVHVVDNSIDEVQDGTCTLKFTVSSPASDYDKLPVADRKITVVDDDTANIFLYTIEKENYGIDFKLTQEASSDFFKDSYQVQFLNFYIEEGETAAYGIKVTSEPTTDVTITPNVTLLQRGNSTILEPPSITVKPTAITFNNKNWMVYHKFTLEYSENNVHHSINRFEIFHEIVSADNTYNSLSTNILTVVDAANDDTPGVDIIQTGVFKLT